ncbi:MarR family transcriptional regulator [Paenibacillus sp. JZ16]|uniref:MarR family winged helix-turn-helix transcriptional regulator n=1 Tax=unclassified Paenibacillus TaxID=185978 RepID=UPI00188A75BD|nr:MarR family transcriptional regulator [Paenibacillus sp. JZ16]
MDNPELRDVTEHREQIVNELRRFGANYAELSHRFATSLNLHSTDAIALIEIFYAEDIGSPLSPARLSERISLSSGATTALLNRLERAGHIYRTREATDRRMVTLHSGPNVQAHTAQFFGPLANHVDSMLREYTDLQLIQYVTFLNKFNSTMRLVLDEQQQEPNSE